MSTSNELRVFISSTFRDLQEEREHLIKKIFPEIRSLCRARGIRFTEVDLRWGLTDEDVGLGRVIRTCLEEVDRCRPYFIGITGDRYGFIPTHLEIQKDPSLLEQYPWIEDAAIDEMSITEMEAYYAVLNPATSPSSARGGGGARFYFRRHRASLDDAADDDVEGTRLAAYQERIRAAGVSIEQFRDAGSLGEQIYDDLIEIIKRDFADARPPTPLEEERARHDAFSLSRRRAYISNAVYLKRLNDHAEGDGPPLVVYAESGSGKSSLFAYWAEQYRRKHPDAHVIEHYVGIGATATDHYAVIRHICMEINERFGRTEEIPSEPAKLDLAFGQWLGYADHELRKQRSPSDSSPRLHAGAPHPSSLSKPSSLIIILDGLNQLQGSALSLRWIPDVISPNIRLILSSTVEGTLVELQKRGWQRLGMQALSEAERETIVVRYLAEYHKSLNPDQIRRIASDYKCGHPLFLKTLLEELRLIGRHEDLEHRIEEYLESTGTEDLFQRMLERMEEDHGARVVRETLSLVWASRSGLDEAELSNLTGSSRLKLATIIAGLDYHLVRKEARLTFFHDYLRRAVEKRYLRDDQLRRRTHLRLADFFERSELSPRSALERVWQYDQAGDDARLMATLGNLSVLQLLYVGPGVYEVLTHWSHLREVGYDPETIYREGLDHVVQTTDNGEYVKSLATVADILERMASWPAAIAMQRRILEATTSAEFAVEAAYAARALGGLLYKIADYDEALTWLEVALQRFEELGDRRGAARAISNMGSVFQHQGDADRGLEYYLRSLGIAEEVGDLDGVSRSIGNIGNVYLQRGERDRALECYNRQLDTAEELGDRVSVATAINNIGNVYVKRGEYDRAMEYYQRKLGIVEELGDRDGVAGATNNIGNVYLLRGEFDRALECYQRHLSISEELGDRGGTIDALFAIGAIHINREEYEQALECHHRALSIAEETGNRQSGAIIKVNMARVYYERGEYERTLEYCKPYWAYCKETGDRLGVAEVANYMGVVRSLLGEFDTAFESFEQYLSVSEELGIRPGVVNAATNMGVAYALRREYDLALACLDRALGVQREIGGFAEVVEAQQTRAGVLLDIVQQETMPEYLPSHLPGATVETWRAMSLRSARDDVDESIANATKHSKKTWIFSGRLLLVRLDVAEGNAEAALQIVGELHNQTTTDEQRAALHYWLWKLNLEPEVDHRIEAERLHSKLVVKTPKYEYKTRIEELGMIGVPNMREEPDASE